MADGFQRKKYLKVCIVSVPDFLNLFKINYLKIVSNFLIR